MADPTPTRISQLTDRLTTVARDDELVAVDVSESVIASKVKIVTPATLADTLGSYAEPSPIQQLDVAVNYGLTPAGAVTNDDIGGLGGLSWEISTSTQFAAAPAGRALLTLAGEVYTLRLSWQTREATSGDPTTRRSADTALNRLRYGDTLRFDSWANNAGANPIVVPFLIVADPVRDAATMSYTFTLRQIRTGVTITNLHRVPLGAVHPVFGCSTGVRQQRPTEYSDAVPQAPGTGTPGTSDTASRGDHVHPAPTLAQLGLTTIPEIRRHTARDLAWPGSHWSPRSVATDGVTTWVGTVGTIGGTPNPAGGVGIVAFTNADGTRNTAREPTVAGGFGNIENVGPSALAVGDGKLWINHGRGGASQAYPVVLALTDLSVQTVTVGQYPHANSVQGMAADATHLYAVTGGFLYRWAFTDLATRTQVLNFVAGFTPQGVCVGPTTIWLAVVNLLYAYEKATFERRPSDDLVVNDPGTSARAATYDSGVILVGGAANNGYMRGYREVQTVIRSG